jgi:hypothetical protein
MLTKVSIHARKRLRVRLPQTQGALGGGGRATGLRLRPWTLTFVRVTVSRCAPISIPA